MQRLCAPDSTKYGPLDWHNTHPEASYFFIIKKTQTTRKDVRYRAKLLASLSKVGVNETAREARKARIIEVRAISKLAMPTFTP
jgi:hypothetical protein